jgi:rhodanese-related sulfurtransferase
MKTGPQLLAETREKVTEVSVSQVMDMQKTGEPLTLLDVRDLHEVNLGKIPGAVHISRGNLESKVEAIVPRDAHVVIYCASGNRSVFAADRLTEMGYANVSSMAGGFRGWAEAGGDVE